MTTEDIQAEARVTVTFNIEDIFRASGYEGSYERLPDILVVAVARAVVENLVADGARYRSLHADIARVRDEVIREKVAPIIDEAFSGVIQKTNSYGEPSGTTTTLREIIIAESHKAITGPADSYGSRGPSKLQALIAKEIGAAWDREIKATIDEAKAEVRKAVQEKASTILAQTIQQMASS